MVKAGCSAPLDTVTSLRYTEDFQGCWQTIPPSQTKKGSTCIIRVLSKSFPYAELYAFKVKKQHCSWRFQTSYERNVPFQVLHIVDMYRELLWGKKWNKLFLCLHRRHLMFQVSGDTPHYNISLGMALSRNGRLGKEKSEDSPGRWWRCHPWGVQEARKCGTSG